MRSGAIKDASHLWWAIRPSLKYPTLELRAPDCCTRIGDAVALASLLVLFTGIHNAWDIAVWMTIARRDPEGACAAAPPADPGQGKDQRPS